MTDCWWDKAAPHPATVEVFWPGKDTWLPYCERHGKNRASVWGTTASMRMLALTPDPEAHWDE